MNLCLDASIDAPPSTFPVKKYSDLSGLPVSILHAALAFGKTVQIK